MMEWSRNDSDEQVSTVDAYMTPKGPATTTSVVKSDGSYKVELRDPWISEIYEVNDYSYPIANGSGDDVENAKALCSTIAMEFIRNGALGGSTFSPYDDSLTLLKICMGLRKDGVLDASVDVDDADIHLNEETEGDGVAHAIIMPSSAECGCASKVTLFQKVDGELFKINYKIESRRD